MVYSRSFTLIQWLITHIIHHAFCSRFCFCKQRKLVWLLCIFFYAFGLVVGRGSQPETGPVLHTKEPGGGAVLCWSTLLCCVDVFRWFLIPQILVFLAQSVCFLWSRFFTCFFSLHLTEEWFFLFFVFLILQVLDCQWLQFCYITLQIHILLIKRLLIWMSIMAVCVSKINARLHIHPLGLRYTHKPRNNIVFSLY